mmetsp:Transcript_21206/g.50618  ORF Transcript_21206/g.50618 Transcript_21206/m.50618 type:complete len:82 (-) Transcript_21206:408-653(-)
MSYHTWGLVNYEKLFVFIDNVQGKVFWLCFQRGQRRKRNQNFISCSNFQSWLLAGLSINQHEAITDASLQAGSGCVMQALC